MHCHRNKLLNESSVLVSGDIFIIPFFERFCKVDRKKVLKSEHPTEFGKTSKKEKNTAVIFKERRTNQILQSNNGNKTNWKQSTLSGAYLEASFRVLTSWKDKKCTCHKTSHFPSHSSKLMLSGGQTLTLDVLQECQIDHRNVNDDRHLSGPWVGFTQVTLVNNTPPRGYPWSVRRLTNIQAT